MDGEIRERIISWYEQGLRAVDPYRATQLVIEDIAIPDAGKLIVIAVGKAAIPMATAAVDALGKRITAGLAVTKAGQELAELDGFHVMEAAHPVPDLRSLDAGERALDLVADLGSNDTVIALISGGGSALMERPADEISLMDMQVTTELLMYAGAGIYELNTVRKQLSTIKGGGLRRAAGDARVITLVLSDVMGNDLGTIASGPTIPMRTNYREAWRIIEDYRIAHQIPEAVRAFLTGEHPPETTMDTTRDVQRIIADNTSFVQAVYDAATEDGFRVSLAWPDWRGEVGDLSERVVHDCRDAPPDIDVLLGGGEATSIVRGSGQGGRNCETSLLVARHFTAADDWVFASLASDGDDGNSAAAGAIVDVSVGSDHPAIDASLANSDSANYLAQHDALLITGQTGTNVNDVYIAMRTPTLQEQL